MAINWKVHRSLIILVAAVTALGLMGVLDSLGYPLSFQLFGGVTLQHLVAAGQVYIAIIMWKRYV